MGRLFKISLFMASVLGSFAAQDHSSAAPLPPARTTLSRPTAHEHQMSIARMSAPVAIGIVEMENPAHKGKN
jgi:hypothetical protein